MSYTHTLFDIDLKSHIATITLNKPERMNAIDQGDAADILDICKQIRDDDEIWSPSGPVQAKVSVLAPT